MQQPSNLVGQQLGNYRLIQHLGRGGFAEVYLGEHIHLKTQVAVKMLLTQLTQEAVEAFRREAQMIAHLRHPHIVQVHDFGIEHETAYLVMDYAPHGTLRQHHPKGTRLPLVSMVPYIKQIAQALQYAHEQRLVHRDVKPENMLIGPRHEVLLSDFGIALTTHRSISQSTQNIAGTIVYMAPEQLQGRPCPASDQYALAIVAYEWLCGRRPFEGAFTEIAFQHAMTPPPPLRRYLPAIPSEIEQVVMTALQKDPQQRFPTVGIFAQAFEQVCLRQNATVAMSTFQMASTFIMPPSPSGAVPPPSFSMPTSTGFQQPPPSFSMPTSTGFQQPSPIFPGTTPSSPLSTISSPPVITESPLAVSSMLRPEQSRRSFSRRAAMIGIVGMVAAASSGLTWVVLSQRGSNSLPASSSQKVPASTSASSAANTSIPPATPITATAPLLAYQRHTDDLVGVGWSPSGADIATAAQDGTAQVWSAEDGHQLFSYSSQVTPAQSEDYALAVSWSSDSKRLAIGFVDGTAQSVDATSGKQLFSYGGTQAQINSVAWSPDGNALALARSDGVVQVYEVASGKQLARFTGHVSSVLTVVWSHDGKRIASGGEDATVQVWNAATGQALLTFKEHTKQVSSLAWSGDDSRIASCSWDNTVMIWDSRSGRKLLVYNKHKGGWLNAVAWSHQGRYIASGGEVGSVTGNVYIGTRGTRDMNMHVWDAQTGNTHTIYQSLPIYGLAWSPDDMRIATACTNNVAQVWRVL